MIDTQTILLYFAYPTLILVIGAAAVWRHERSAPKSIENSSVIPLGWKLVPEEPTDEMINAALLSIAAHLNIPGSKLTVNREKMRIRYKAMLNKSPEP